jgi:phosphate starvation-inducible protein PhoH
MPAKSQAQFRAMEAAAHGQSTLGISATVGKEYVAATKNAKALPKRKMVARRATKS